MLANNTKTAQEIAQKLLIIEVEAWFDTVSKIAKSVGLHAELESRVWKSTIIYSLATGKRVGRIWVTPIGTYKYYLVHWRTQSEEVASFSHAIADIADSIK